MCHDFGHFSGFLHHFVLANLATSSIRVKVKQSGVLCTYCSYWCECFPLWRAAPTNTCVKVIAGAVGLTHKIKQKNLLVAQDT